MSKNNAVLEDTPAVPALTPELLAKIKKEDMKQAIFERFSGKGARAAFRAAQSRTRSPYWRPADEEC